MKTKSDVLRDRMILLVLLVALMIIAGVTAGLGVITPGDWLIVMTLAVVGFLIDTSLGFMAGKS